MKKLLACLLILFSIDADAQFRHRVFDDHQPGYCVGAYGRAQVATNALSTDLIWQAYQGKALDRNKREQAVKRAAALNGVGVDLDYGIFARHLPDSAKELGWYINIADRTHASGRLSKDFLSLSLLGNAQFAGETADLSKLSLQFLTYKQFEVGILKEVRKSTGVWRIGFGLSLLTGNRNLSLNVDEATLYTHPDGDYLDGEVHGDIRSSSLSSTQYFDANGIGLSAALNLEYEAEKFGITFSADDLGFLRWNKHLKHSELDSVFRFEGVEVDLLGTGGGSFANINLDSVVDGFVTVLEGTSYNSIIPGRIRLEGFYKMKPDGVQIYAGLQYRIANGYQPYGYLGARSSLAKGFYVDGRFAYGGFGSWHLGFEVRKRFKNVFEVRLGTNNLEGFVLPMVGTSQSAYVSLAGYF